MITKFEFYKRLCVVLIAIIQPFVIYWVCGDLPSISASWSTILQPLFISTNAMVSYFFFDLPKWRMSSISLLLLTAFSVDSFPIFHNIIAIIFFVFCIYSLLSIHKFKYYVLIYLFSILIGLCFNLFWLETFAIITLCVYHLHILLYTNKLLRNRSNNF